MARALVYEYSYCYAREDIERKFRSFAHAVYSPDEIAQSIACNHVPISSMRVRQPDLESHVSWFKKVRLTRGNAPEYVRRNQDLLRTHVVPTDYEANRRKAYPELFTAQKRAKRRNRELRAEPLGQRAPRRLAAALPPELLRKTTLKSLIGTRGFSTVDLARATWWSVDP